jgi:hypothetical protein
MDVLALIQEAEEAGLAVTIEGGALKVRGPREAESLVRQLFESKAEVLAALAAAAKPPPEVATSAAPMPAIEPAVAPQPSSRHMLYAIAVDPIAAPADPTTAAVPPRLPKQFVDTLRGVLGDLVAVRQLLLAPSELPIDQIGVGAHRRT